MPCRPARLTTSVALAAATALAGCANPAAEQAAFAQTALIGMPKQLLLSCAGVPLRSTSIGNRDWFTYSTGRLVSYPSVPLGVPRPWPGHRFGSLFFDDDLSWRVDHLRCEATFSLYEGRVDQLIYRADSSYSQCFAIVANCLSLVPPPTPAPVH